MIRLREVMTMERLCQDGYGRKIEKARAKSFDAAQLYGNFDNLICSNPVLAKQLSASDLALAIDHIAMCLDEASRPRT